MKLDVMTASLTAALMLAACGGNTDGDTHTDRDVAGVDSYGADTADLDSAGGPDQGSTGRDTHYWQDTAGADAPVDAVVPDDAIDSGREFGIDVINIGYDPAFSECGGFASGDGAVQQSRDPFCGQSLMKWVVDPVTGEIRLTFENFFFNCCGEHEIAVENDDGLIIVTIIDRPTDGGERCSCTCGYDYAVTMPPLKDAVQATFQIYYVIDGEYSPPEAEGHGGHLWVDLTTGSGEIPIGGIPSTCEDFMYQATNVRISDCGGFEPNPEHCRPETFEWSYNPETRYLHVINRNVIMNCCAERHLFSRHTSLYGVQFVELDVPPDSGRCDCMCMIDYSMDLYTYDANYSARHAITRTVTDAAVPDQIVWKDHIDETAPGVVVIREAADNCI